jgi:hypothetical protein
VTVARKLWAKIGYEPHEKQMEFHASRARFRVPVCGRRFGKSKMAAADKLPDFLRPGTLGWIVGPEYSDSENEFNYFWDFLIKLGLLDKMKHKARNTRTGEMYIEAPWGSRVVARSAKYPDSLVGKGLHWLIVSEAAKQNPDVWEKYLRPALADFKGDAIFPSTPEGFNWFYDLYQLGQGEDPEWESWRYPAWENPYVYPRGFEDPEVQSQMRTPDDPFFWQEIGADFRSVVGLIYPEFEPARNVRQHAFRPEWENQLWMDFGFTNPTAALDAQIDPDGNVYVWREYYERHRTAAQNAHELKYRLNPAGYHIDIIFGDAADPSSVEELGRHLAPCIAYPEAKDFQRGVGEVKDRLVKPSLFIDPSCVNTIAEFQTYKTAESKNRDPRANVREEPAKRMDHAMDALRYGVMHKFVIGADSHVTNDFFAPVPVNVRDEEWDGIPDGIFTREVVL